MLLRLCALLAGLGPFASAQIEAAADGDGQGLAVCAREPQDSSDSSAARAGAAPHALVLVSIDGFRHDYLELHEAPNLARFARDGVRAEALVPVFPTSTFPNHYTLVTGLWPDHHGVVGNTMYDPELDAAFRIHVREDVEDARWWGGEPLWVSVERAGLVAATMFWPGSEAAIGGVRPTFWFDYDVNLDERERVARVLAWLDLPVGERPSLVTLYFSSVDAAGHRFGPRSPEVARAVLSTDARLGELFDGLAQRGLADTTDVVVVSDHGMVELDREREIVLDDLVDLEGLHVVTLSPVLGIRPPPERFDAVLAALTGAHPHLAVWRREDVPARLHHGAHRRIPPIVGLADEGWRVVLRADSSDEVEDGSRAPKDASRRARGDTGEAQDGRGTSRGTSKVSPEAGATNTSAPASSAAGGTHGYDPELPSMHAFFAARGPSFRRGVVVPAFENVHLYAFLTQLLGVDAAPNDGDPRALVHLLAADTAPAANR